VGFDYRSKIASPVWRSMWDYALFVGGAVPAIMIGIAFGNLLLGVPFYFDDTFRSFYTGNLMDLLNPFALAVGMVSLSMFVMHGGTFLLMKTEGVVQYRAWKVTRVAAVVTTVLFVSVGYWLMNEIDGYRVVSEIDRLAGSTPFGLNVVRETGAWMHNFIVYPWMWLAPILGMLGALLVWLLGDKRPALSWLSSSLSVVGIASTAGLAMFPFVLPSITHPSQSLLMWNATSSQQTLWLMLIAAAIFVPLIITYTSWVFHVLRGKVTQEKVEADHASY